MWLWTYGECICLCLSIAMYFPLRDNSEIHGARQLPVVNHQSIISVFFCSFNLCSINDNFEFKIFHEKLCSISSLHSYITNRETGLHHIAWQADILALSQEQTAGPHRRHSVLIDQSDWSVTYISDIRKHTVQLAT